MQDFLLVQRYIYGKIFVKDSIIFCRNMRKCSILYGGPLRSCRRFIFHSMCARRTRHANVE